LIGNPIRELGASTEKMMTAARKAMAGNIGRFAGNPRAGTTHELRKFRCSHRAKDAIRKSPDKLKPRILRARG
jgi:hypothetical protein